MQALRPIIFEGPSIAVQETNLNISLGNTMGCFAAGNRRPGYVPNLGSDPATGTIPALDDLHAEAIKPPPAWVTGLPPFAKDTSTETVLSVQQAIENIKKSAPGLTAFINAMTVMPEFVPDIGQDFLKRLGIGDLYSREWFNLPAFGYARRYIRVRDAETAVRRTWDVTDPRTPHPAHGWSRTLASIAMVSDRARWNASLIPPGYQVSYSGHDARDKLFGALRSLREQLSAVYTMSVLYALSGPLTFLRAAAPLWRVKLEVCAARDPWARDKIALWLGDLDFLLSLPLHPMLKLVADGHQPGTADTYASEAGPCYWKPLLASSHFTAGKSAASAAQLATDEIDLLTRAIVAEVDHPDLSSWGDWASGEGSTSGGIGIISLARALRTIPAIADKLSDLPNKLGWASVSAGKSHLDQSGADFILTDGKSFSRDPLAGLLGFSPVLSMGNRRLVTQLPHDDLEFNLGAEEAEKKKRNRGSKDSGDNIEASPRGRCLITVSPMVVDGYVDVVGDPLVGLRVLLPEGMGMGEPNVDYINFSGQVHREPMLDSLLTSIEGKTRVVLREWYNAPSSPGAKDFIDTDWDGIGASQTEEVANAAFYEAYASSAIPVREARFLQSDRFYHRFPVMLARSNRITVYDQLFTRKVTYKYAGRVAFGTDVTLGHSPTVTQAVVDLASKGDVGPARKATPLEGDQIDPIPVELTGGGGVTA